MLSRLPIRVPLAGAMALMLTAALAGCGQKGPLYIPDTAAAAQRATLPQTVIGGSGSPAAARSGTPPSPPPAAPPMLPDIQ